MGFLFWLRLAVLLAGAGVAVHGCYVLATGRLSGRSRAAFRSTRDAGMYSLCSGLGLIFLALGQSVPDDWDLSIVLILIALALTLTFMGLAFLRYRPRKRSR
ncbi:hypothetical protein [Paractinoplanes maris]|uniref:hypothetical protein n=1 Tax=Paractinoplanes maris TaxID=1734446 RepID=UPI00201FCBB2|nr:hypothetical protein [Actinoplanes maris]